MSTIPVEWLIPQKLQNEWLFECSTTVRGLVKTQQAGQFFRQLVTTLENDLQIVDYNLRVQHNHERDRKLDVLIRFGNHHRKNKPESTPICMSCETKYELSKVTLLSEQQHTRAWLDCRARPKFIITPIRHVERFLDLSYEDGEMEAFWRDALELVDKECNQFEDYYPPMVVNHGTYRNHAHLHLKINFIHDVWKEVIAPRHTEQLEQLKQLLQIPDVVETCLGSRYWNKINAASKEEPQTS